MDTRDLYKFIRLVMSIDEITLGRKLDLLKDIKRQLRSKRDFDLEPQYHYEDEYGDSMWYKEFFNEPFTEEEKMFFIEGEWRHINSPYDCTGLLFTKSIRICNFKEPNSFGAMSVVYYFLGRDV